MRNVLKMMRWVAMAGGLFACAGGAFGETIRLLGKVTVEARQDVRLGDIATISGTDARRAEELSNMIIVSGVERGQKIKAESVLIAVMAQRGTGAGGALQISGAGECEISLALPRKAAAGVANGAMVEEAKPAVEMARVVTASVVRAETSKAVAPVAAVVAGNSPTLEGAILAAIAKAVELPADQYKVVIESNSPHLKHEVAAGRQWLCRPLTKAIWGTVQVEAQLVEGTKILEKMNVSTTVLRKQKVLIATRKIGRGELVTADAMEAKVAEMDRNIPTLVSDDSVVVGLEAKKDIEVGTKIDERDFRPALMAHRNDRVTVVVMAGSFRAQITGQAMDDAKLRERIQVRNEKTAQQIDVLMIGKGIGVAGGVLTDEQEKTLLETMR